MNKPSHCVARAAPSPTFRSGVGKFAASNGTVPQYHFQIKFNRVERTYAHQSANQEADKRVGRKIHRSFGNREIPSVTCANSCPMPSFYFIDSISAAPDTEKRKLGVRTLRNRDTATIFGLGVSSQTRSIRHADLNSSETHFQARSPRKLVFDSRFAARQDERRRYAPTFLKPQTWRTKNPFFQTSVGIRTRQC